jgi:hypothetical protein
MLGSPEPRENMPEVRVLCVVEVEVEVRCVGDEERRRENMECFCGGGGGGEGSRLDPKSGMVVVVVCLGVGSGYVKGGEVAF